MTFVLDPTCFPHVFSSDAINFPAAVFPIVNKVGEFIIFIFPESPMIPLLAQLEFLYRSFASIMFPSMKH